MRKMVVVILTVWLIFATLYWQPVRAADLYVSPSGIDTGNCQASPCRTIGYAVGHAIPNDTIHVASGTYSPASGESFPIVINTSLTLMGSGAETTTIDGIHTTYVILVGNATVNIGGFTITGGSDGIFYALWGYGTITNNIISGNTNRGIMNSASSPAITNNSIFGNNYGIQNLSSSNPVITNNTIFGNFYGIENDYSDPTITNNTISGNNFFGIYNYYSNLTITNNIITSNGWYGISDLNSSSTNTYNDVWDNDWGNYNGASSGIGSISADPLFFSPSDFHLQCSSPAKDAGNNSATAIPSTDKDGRPRILQGTVDMGAYEADCLGPVTSSVLAAPNPTNCAANVTLTATIDDSTTGESNIAAAEYFIDVVGADGTGTAMSAQDGALDSETEDATAIVPIGTLSSGLHTLYVHGQDAFGNWGATDSHVLNVVYDCSGPITSNLSATPNPTNCTANVILTATVDDSTTDNSSIDGAEYFIDSVGANGAGTAMSAQDGTFDEVTEGVTATVPVGALSNDNHTLYVHGRDSYGNWGATQSYVLNVVNDCSGPVTSNTSATPNPTNCAINVTLGATVDDSTTGNSSIQAVEYFIDTVGADGTGTAMTASDGLFDEVAEDVAATVPVGALSTGPHTLYVHGQDAQGNWGTYQNMTLTVSCQKTQIRPQPPDLTPTTQNHISQGNDLSKQAQDLLSQAKSKNLDTATCEKLIDEAYELLDKAKTHMTNPIYANNLALQAIEKLKQAIDCLKALLG